MQLPWTFVAVWACALALCAGLTWLVRALAWRWGAVAWPTGDRWHKQPTAMFGGVAIALTIGASYAVVHGFGLTTDSPSDRPILAASAVLFGVGLIDDVWHIKPYQKLVGQIVGASVVIYAGVVLPWTGSPVMNMAITIFWLIGITNAVNLLDNMDGLAAGVAAIASVFLAVSLFTTGHLPDALLVGTLAAALVGFLVYNSNPASVFMGDCGSMFVGLFLAGAAILNASGGRTRSFVPVLAVPVLILFLPIFDTTLVTILRKVAGRPASQGGADHTSHRLVALGLSERRAVWMLYALAALSGILALLVSHMTLDFSLAAITGFTLILALLGVYIAGVKVYDDAMDRPVRDDQVLAFLARPSYKRRVFEVMLDVVLIILAYYGAYALRLGSLASSQTSTLFLRTLPVVVCIKLAVLLLTGVYRGTWRYMGVDDLVVMAKAVVVGSTACGLILTLVLRFDGISRAVLTIDALLMLLLLGGSRLTFRLLRRLIPVDIHRGRRVLIYGAGDAGELLLRELRNNRDLRYAPVGFMDDDPAKKGKVIHGLKVFGGTANLSTLCREHDVDEVIVSSSRLPQVRLNDIACQCSEAHVELTRLTISFEQLSPD